MSAFLAKNPFLGSAPSRADLAGLAGAKPDAAKAIRPAPAETTRLGPWLLESLIHEGQLTQVHSARPAGAADTAVPAQYVAKVLREVWHDNPMALRRMRQEATIGRCVAHRHVMPVMSVHVHRPPYYVVLPRLKGTNMAAWLAARGPMNAPLALWVVRQAAQALEALHTAGYLHGDVKPGNLLLAAEGHVTLLDLTCAHRIDDPEELSEIAQKDQPLLGTPNYLAPEVFFGKRVDVRSDLHSLGLTLYEMLAGRLPDLPESMTELVAFKRCGSMPNVRAFAPQAPQEVAELVRRLIARDPLRRPDTAREVVHELMRLEIATLRQRVPV
jgi:eukaryotic-like serine/threonine-protein kinase